MLIFCSLKIYFSKLQQNKQTKRNLNMNCFALCAWALCNLLSFNTILYGHVIFNFWSLGNRRQKPQKRPFIRPKKSHCFPPNLILETTPKICTLVRFAPQSLVTLSPSHGFFYGQSTPAIQMYSHPPTPLALLAHPGPATVGLALQWKQTWSGYPPWRWWIDGSLAWKFRAGLQVNKHRAVLSME